MDGSTFDRLTKSFTEPRSRRTLSRLMGGLAVGGSLILVGAAESKAKKKKKVTLCHQGQTVRVSRKARKKHLKHGDTLGACPVCSPNCTGKACGDNGCGGSCGPCEGGTCTNGTCVCPGTDFNCDGTCIPDTAKCCFSGTNCRDDATERCINQQCVVWQGTCTGNADRCVVADAGCTGPDGGPPGSCYTSVSGETRCGETGLGSVEQCDECTSDSDCAVYGVGAFCARSTGDRCATATDCAIGQTFCRMPPRNG